MDNFITGSFPESIKKELEAIQRLILPLAKKTSKYMFWTFPLIGISIFNIIYLLFFTERATNIYVMLVIYAIIGAIGLSLLKETKLNKKEIEKIGIRYIVGRIKKSRFVPEDRKNQYIHKIKITPMVAMEQFVKFLQEEERLGRHAQAAPKELKN
ncbi:YwnF family protein [Caldibacillus lycopersici]|uniref:YwnF family protein n=1 Tax=Perspicuibacillus lycopersici TaxID=1325689 RepID=A0AAE3ISX9_9BACI|nr:YwnF family protein [Perspicuibacillus lycopersici]MCU9612861.1 YwnF family protein [Perspicuibacillus lycopersici]